MLREGIISRIRAFLGIFPGLSRGCPCHSSPRRRKSCRCEERPNAFRTSTGGQRRYGNPRSPDVGSFYLCPEEEMGGRQEVSPGADAGAAFPLQPGVRRMRQGAVSPSHFEEAAHGRRVLGGDGRGALPDCVRAGRRAAAAPGDCERSSRVWWRARGLCISAPTRWN